MGVGQRTGSMSSEAGKARTLKCGATELLCFRLAGRGSGSVNECAWLFMWGMLNGFLLRFGRPARIGTWA